MNNRIILHIDMNSYFASVEQQANPHLRGKPIGVCEHLGGIIIAPSVEAKRLGIKLGTTVWEARKIYPDIVLLPVDPEKYRYITQAFLKILMDYTDQLEKYSIDEAFLDITGICNQRYEEALLLALEIKQRLRFEVGEWITASIGVGPNKLVAKIAADLGEGDIDRICVIRPEDISGLYNRLKLTDIPGIGKRLELALNKLGIFSLRDLASYPLENLLNQFGVLGYELHQLANFQDTVEIVTTSKEEIKSMGHSYTLPKAIGEIGEIRGLMFKLAEKIGRRMRRLGAKGNVIHYFHSDKQRHFFHKQRRIRELINDGRGIYQVTWKIFCHSCHSETAGGGRRIPKILPFPLHFDQSQGQDDRMIGNVPLIKIMGITVSGLEFDFHQEPLFEEYKRPFWLVRTMDQINDKYGELTISSARLLEIPKDWVKDTVGFGRMKELKV